MKKILLLSFLCIAILQQGKSQTTYTSPNTTTTVTVTDAASWHALGWTPAWVAGPGPDKYIIQPNYTILVGPGGGNTVNLSGEPNLTLDVQGALGFYNGNNVLQLAATGTITISVGGVIGYNAGGSCCAGNPSNNIIVGTTNMTGPFHFYGPSTAITGGAGNGFTNSTAWLVGATSTAWATASNWTNGVPSATKNTYITNATTNDPILTTNVQTLELYVQSGGLLTISSATGQLTANDVVDNAGTITINSDAALKLTAASNLVNETGGIINVKSGSSLVQAVGSTLTNTGTFNVERAIPGGVSFVSSPINNIGVNSFGITTTGANGGQVLTHQVTPCIPTAVDPTSPYGNLMEMHENATLLTPAANCSQELWFVKSSGTLTNGRGYSLANGAATLNFTGTVNNGNISYTGLTRQGNANLNQQDGTVGLTTWGWHLVGNPYPSPITFNTNALLAMGFDAQVHLYNHNGAYTGTWVSAAPNTVVTIPVGQSFQIRKTAVGGTSNFDLTNSLRLVANPTFYKILQNDFLKVSINNGVKTDTTNVLFTAGATDNFDPAYDANRLSDAIQHPMIYSVVDSQMLGFNALPVLNASDTKTVTIGVRTEVQGAHTLTFNGVNTLNSTVVMKDLKLNITQPVSEGMVYHFTTVTGDNRSRFELVFTASATGITTHFNSNVQLFPNPAFGTTTLLLGNNHGYDLAAITDVCGKTVREYQLTNNESTKTLDINGLTAGIYFVKLRGTSGSTAIKLITK